MKPAKVIKVYTAKFTPHGFTEKLGKLDLNLKNVVC